MTIDILFFIVIGLLAGFLSGMLGLGGGVVIVPGLVEWIAYTKLPIQQVMQLCVGTSLSVMGMTALVSGFMHHKRGAVKWELVRLLAPGTVAGAILGVQIADLLPSLFLKKMFGVLLLLIAIQLLLFARPKEKEKLHMRGWMFLVSGFVVGILAGMMGIGGGLLLVPLMLFNGVALLNASATAPWCTLPTVIAGTVMAAWTGMNEPDLPRYTLGYIYWPATLGIGFFSLFMAPLGVKIAHDLDKVKLQRIFSLVLLLVSARMIVS